MVFIIEQNQEELVINLVLIFMFSLVLYGQYKCIYLNLAAFCLKVLITHVHLGSEETASFFAFFKTMLNLYFEFG